MPDHRPDRTSPALLQIHQGRSVHTVTSLALACALICAGLTGLPQQVWAQGKEQSAQTSAEGNRLFKAGFAAYQAGKLSEAARLWEKARAVFTRELGQDHLATLVSMGNLANIYRALGQLENALALQEKTLASMRTTLGQDHAVTLAAMDNLALTYTDLGQNDKALELQGQAFVLMSTTLGQNHPDTLAVMNNLANTYRALGQYDKALALQEQTLALMRATQGEVHPTTLTSMGNLANTYRDLGQHNKALALQEETYTLRLATLGQAHPNTLASMSNLAAIYRDLGHLDKALALQEQTLALMRATQGEVHPDTLASMSNLANTYRDLGQLEKALKLDEQTLPLRRAKLGQDHPDTLASMHNLANTYRYLGQIEKALTLDEQTLPLRRAKLGQDHPDTLASMHNLASTYYLLGQMDKALAQVEAIRPGVERLRKLPGLLVQNRQSIFAPYSDNYQRYASWYAQAARLSEAFDLGDHSKARTLSESIGAQAALRALPDAEQASLQALQAQARARQLGLEALTQQPKADPAALLAAQKAIESGNAEYLAFNDGLKSRYPRYATLSDLKPVKAGEAARLLAPAEAFVSYLVRSDDSAQVFVLDASGKPRWMDLGKLANHRHSVAAYRELLAPSTAPSAQGRLVALAAGGYQWLLPGEQAPQGASAAASTPKAALKLLGDYWHDKLIKPVLGLAGSKARWIISPDKDLALLPFDTLPERQTSTLGQTRTVTLVQSFSVYALLKQRQGEYAKLPRTKELFAMGNAVYGPGWDQGRGIARGASGSRGFAGRNASALAPDSAQAPLTPAAERYALSQLRWDNLLGTAREIKAVSTVFAGAGKGASGSVDTYSGLDASEGHLQQLNAAGKLKDYRYLLFSAHGYLAQNPDLSALVLSQQGNPAGVDGYVTAAEWPLYDVKSDLTVLSACDTGVGKTQAGESVMGLPYALFIAGNKNTVLSLWPVDDDATAEFMARLFTKLKVGTSQPEALAEVKREFMRHARWSAPRYWAAFVLYGV